ncbi:MAG TPA: hypothetical protein VKA13_03850 [Gammaproteobacteria bacterium]|nr:hypothetical protein [Gammaproteobacteria bacterium]
MNVNGSLQTGLTGIERGLQDAKTNAAQIASAKQMENHSSKDLAKSLVVLAADKTQVAASAKAVKGADHNLGKLLDVTA